MRRNKSLILILLVVFISIFPLSAKAEYTPSISCSASLTLTQNRTISNFELPLRTSGFFKVQLTPLSFNFNKAFMFDIELSFYSNSNTLAWNNTQLLGYYGLEGSVLFGGNIKRYQIKAGLGLAFNNYFNEDYYFLALNAHLRQSVLLNEYLAFTFPLQFSFRQEVFDYRFGFAFTYYPLGGAL